VLEFVVYIKGNKLTKSMDRREECS